jgi:biopolymer transport protein TolQ
MIAGPWQIGAPVPTTALELILNATTITQVVLVVLAVLSLLSWAIMFGAWRQLNKAMRMAARYEKDFEQVSRIEEAGSLAKRLPKGALPRLFMRGIHFVSETRARNEEARVRALGTGNDPSQHVLSASQIETLRLVLDAEASGERDRIGRYLPWLATIGSASPLIGLFGTVLGIIEAFVGIATKGSGNLAAVAPGVGEALTATAGALAVAIPATFAYNILANKLNRFDGMMENFTTGVIALLAREGHI